jgi:hypothetical protein
VISACGRVTFNKEMSSQARSSEVAYRGRFRYHVKGRRSQAVIGVEQWTKEYPASTYFIDGDAQWEALSVRS